MATRSMFRDLDTGDSSIASTTILKLFEEKSTEDVWSNVSSAGDVLSGLLPKVTALRARADRLKARLEVLHSSLPTTPEASYRKIPPSRIPLGSKMADGYHPPDSFFPDSGSAAPVHLQLNVILSICSAVAGEISQMNEIITEGDLSSDHSKLSETLEKIRSDKRATEEEYNRVLPRSPRGLNLSGGGSLKGKVWVLWLFVVLLGIPMYVDRLFTR